MQTDVTREFIKYREMLRFTWNMLLMDETEKLGYRHYWESIWTLQQSLLRLVFFDHFDDPPDSIRDLKDLDLRTPMRPNNLFHPFHSQGQPGRILDLPEGTVCTLESFYDGGAMMLWDLRDVVVRIIERKDETLLGVRGIVEAAHLKVFVLESGDEATQ